MSRPALVVINVTPTSASFSTGGRPVTVYTDDLDAAERKLSRSPDDEVQVKGQWVDASDVAQLLADIRRCREQEATDAHL